MDTADLLVSTHLIHKTFYGCNILNMYFLADLCMMAVIE